MSYNFKKTSEYRQDQRYKHLTSDDVAYLKQFDANFYGSPERKRVNNEDLYVVGVRAAAGQGMVADEVPSTEVIAYWKRMHARKVDSRPYKVRGGQYTADDYRECSCTASLESAIMEMMDGQKSISH